MTARLVQVTNVSTSVTKEQLRGLFAHLGRIEDVQLYPESETLTATVAAKTGYVRFDRSEFAQAALNLTNTVFLDRPIICSIVKYATSSTALSSKAIAQLCRIPDETVAIKLCPAVNTNVTLIPGGITWPHNIINRIVTIPGVGNQAPSTSFIETIDPNLSERSLPPYPPLHGTMDQQKAEEIRRTIYVSNLDPRIQFVHLYELFNQVGEIRYMRLTSLNELKCENLGLSTVSFQDETIDFNSESIAAYIEFSEQPMVLKALCLNGLNFAERHIKVNHATNSIIIPATNKQQISVDDLRKEISKLRHSSSSTHSSSSHRNRDKDRDRERDRDRDRDRYRDRDRDRDRDHDRHSKSAKEREDRDRRHSSKKESSRTYSRSEKKRDGSVDSSHSEDDQSDDQIQAEANESEAESLASSSDSVPSPKKARRSRSESKSRTKKKSSKDRSPKDRHVSSRSKRSSRSRERERDRDKRDREQRDRDIQKEKELRERLKASSSHRSSNKKSSRDEEVSSSSRKTDQTSSKEHKSGRSNGAKAAESSSSHKRSHSSRKRSSSRSGKSKKRSKSREKSSKDHKKSHSSKKRSKSREKSSRHESGHKHSKSKKDRKEKYDSEESVSANTKTRDYDEEERELVAAASEQIDERKSSRSPNGTRVNEKTNGKETSSDDSGSSSDTSDEEAMDTGMKNSPVNGKNDEHKKRNGSASNN